MTTKRAQDSPVHRVFLWKELCRSACVFAEFSLSLKDSNFFLVSLDKVDKIDVLLEDSLWCERKTLSSWEVKVPNKWGLTARHSRRVSGTGSILRTRQSLCQLLMSFSSDPYRSSNSSLMATLNWDRAAFFSGSFFSQ